MTSDMEDRQDQSEELGTVDRIFEPGIKTKLWNLRPANVCIKDEMTTNADIHRCILTIKEKHMAGTIDQPLQQVNVPESLKQENLDTEQKCHVTGSLLTQKPFPIVLYRVDKTLGMEHPLGINSSTFHQPERQLDGQLSVSGLKTEVCVDPCHSQSTRCADYSPTLANIEESRNLEKRYSCRLCPYRCVWESQLKVHHIRIHNTGDKPYRCSLCPYSSTWKGHLKVHMRTHTGDKPHRCSLCPYSSTQKGHLKVHMRTHTGDKPYRCSLCPYSSVQKGYLKVHMRTHTGDRPYKCSLCAHSCARKSYLQGHMRTHTGDKPYKCTLCAYTSAQKGQLNGHMRTHTGEKPYKCSLCAYRSTRNSYLNEHMRIHTGEKPYKCSLCSNSFAQKYSLKRHMRTHNGDI